MSVEVVIPTKTAVANLASLDTAALRAELARALTVTAETLEYLGAVWRELENRGEDLADLRAGLGRYLPMIAAGQLDAEVVVRFAGRQSLLRNVATLPIKDQRRLALGGEVRILTIDDDGQTVETDVPATALTVQQIRMAFDHGRIRGVDEQRNMLGSARLAARQRSPKLGRQFRVKVDKTAGVVHVGRMTIALSEVIDSLVAAGAIRDQDDA